MTEQLANWRRLAGGLRHVHIDLSTSVGLFRIIHEGKVVYLGCATEFANGGLMKRLRDFTRPGASGRSHHAGALIYKHRDQVEVEVLVTGGDAPAGFVARQIKSRLLKQTVPDWNVPPTKQPVLDGKRRSAR
jgi:hypothetical protein